MTDKFIKTITPENRKNVTLLASGQITQILAAGDKAIIEVRPPKRSDEQNAKLHAMLGDLVKQAKWQGEKRNMNFWKTLVVSGHASATGLPVELTLGFENEIVNVRESTAGMSMKRKASLIEYLYAWGADNGIEWSEPK